MKRFINKKRQRGSALLIVLGFLSFIVVSAVSFAVYMRIERQASSNYRHTVVARHLLDSALYRAIDEIDSELRIKTTKINGSTVQQPRKFPDWPGHVRPSAVPNGQDNDQNARVLSLEALSFLPASLVNDVRRYATTNKADEVNDVNTSDGETSYLGAKWRPLSMPVRSMASGEDAYEEAVIGRYAYLCVNLSDMLNVNVCKATLRDASTNQVGIGYLFKDQTTRTQFEQYRDQDYYYATLQDFYACMAAHSEGTFGSPYHTWRIEGEDTKFGTADNHVLVTDGLAKPEPVSSSTTPVNVLKKTYQTDLETAVDDFATQLASIPTLKADSSTVDHFRNLLMDYLDEDNVPYFKSGWGCGSLYRPTAEMVPKLYQMRLTKPDDFKYSITTESSGTTADPETKYVFYPSVNASVFILDVQTIFPFKHWLTKVGKNSSLILEPEKYKWVAKAYLVVTKTSTDGSLETKDTDLLDLGGLTCIELNVNENNGGGNYPMPDTETSPFGTGTINFTVPNTSTKVDLFSVKNSDGTVTTLNCAKGDYLHIALVVFVGIKQNDSDWVDLVPGYLNIQAPSTDYKYNHIAIKNRYTRDP
jgi:hypothetical protein